MRRTTRQAVRWIGVCGWLAALVLAGCADGPPIEPAAPAPPADGALVAPHPTAGGGFAPKAGSPYYSGEPGAGVQFQTYAATRQESQASPVLTDILTHLPPSYGSTYYDSDPITWGHETTHGINSDVRNYHNASGQRANGFYVLQDRAVVVVEPGIRKADANPFVPTNLRGSRYSLYLEGSHDWDDTPLYLFDEWVAYTNGGEVGVDMVTRGLWNREWRDGVAGQLEFTVYALAVAMAVEELDPTYFQENDQFLEFLAWNTKRAMEIYRQGATFEQFAWDTQDAYYEALRTSAEAAPMREFARRVFGQAWADRWLLGLEGGGADEDPIDDGGGDDDDVVDPGPGGPGGDVEPDPDPDIDPDNLADADDDGIEDGRDRCSATPTGRTVWTDGEWIGCAGGQHRDPLFQAGPDADSDRVPDEVDLCSETASGAAVWDSGDWVGCAGGQLRDRDRPQGPDLDGDGIEDARDLCGGSAPGARVWRSGEWLGCAEGQRRD